VSAPTTALRAANTAPGAAASGPGGARGGSRVRREGTEEAGEPRDPAASRQAVQRGREALDSGRIEEAKVEFERAVAADSRNGTAIAGLADVTYELSDYNNAAYYAHRAARFNPRATKYLVLEGDASFKLGRWSDALGCYQRAQKIDPATEGLDDRIKNVLAKLGRLPK
jgi:tetratricopeptide (TPR) repeat protein